MSTETITAAPVSTEVDTGRPARPDRPRRFDDDALNDAYWARIDAIVSVAPPLTNHQRAVIRTAFLGARAREAA